MSLSHIQAVLILDTEGRRLLAKYYKLPNTPPTFTNLNSNVPEQKSLEKRLSQQTVGENADILLFENFLVVYKQLGDVLIYLVADSSSNEELLYESLITLKDSVNSLLNHEIYKARILEYYDRVALAVDQVVDNGVVITDSKYDVTELVSKRANEDASLNNIDLSEGGLMNMFGFAKSRLADAVRKQLS